jgi:ATP-dependent RNA helicase RhlE
MLDLGFVHDLRKISKMVPKKRQTMLFSATMPKAIADLAADFLTDPVKVEVTPPGKAADKVEQYVHFVTGKGDKTEILRKSLLENPDGRSIVFMRTKHTAEKLMKHLDNIGFSVASIHGNKSQGQRERALKGFRDGEIKTLIATDVAARGIDIPAVSHVYNYDLPEVPDAYVHRIGRTARAGRDGIAIAFCAPDETLLLRDIEKLMGIEIKSVSGERPEALNRPVRGNGNNNNRGGNKARGGNARGNGGGNGESGKSKRRERPARKPFFAEGAEGASEERAERQEHRGGSNNRPQRDSRRNEEFRGQRRNEEAPRSEGDNDLVATSDFRPNRGEQQKRGGGQNRGHQGQGQRQPNNGGNRDRAAHGAHEAGKQRQQHQAGATDGAQAAAKTGGQNRHTPQKTSQGEGRGPVRFGNPGPARGDEQRGGGFQGRKRRPA